MTRRIFLETGVASALSIGLLTRIQVMYALQNQKLNDYSRDKRLYDDLTRQIEIQINIIEGKAIVAHPSNLLE